MVNLEAANNTHKTLTESKLIKAAVDLAEDWFVTKNNEIKPEMPLGQNTKAHVDAIRIVTRRCDLDNLVGVF